MIFSRCRSQKHKYKIVRLLGWFCISLVLGLTLGYFTPTKWGNYSNENSAIAIYVYNSGIHTDLLVPLQTPVWNWQEGLDLKSITPQTNSNEYLAFGFGDRSYFLETSQGASPKFTTLFNALFLPTLPAMRVLAYRDIPQHFPVIKCVKISNFNYLKLVNFINDSFQLDRQNNKMIIATFPERGVGFYEARGTYSILRACNDWTGEALRIAGVNTPVWSGLSSAIMWHLNN